MKNQFSILVLLLISYASSGQQLFSLEEAIDYAISNNGNMKIEQLKLVDADGKIQEYKSIGMPKLTASVDYSRNIQIPVSLVPAEFFGGQAGEFAKVQFGLNNNLTGNLQLSALLFDGSYLQGLKAQRLYKDLISREINLKEYEIRTNVTKAYLAVLIAEKNIEVLNNNISNLTKVRNETKIIYQNGFAEKLDVERLELSLENLNSEKKNVLRLIDLSSNVLKFQMGYPLQDPINLTDAFDNIVNESSIQKMDNEEDLVIANRPEFRILEETERLQHIQLKVIKSGYYPSLSAFVTHQQSLQRNNLFDGDEPGLLPATIAGLSLRIPIFDGNEKKGQTLQTKVAIETLQIQKEEFIKAVQLQVLNAKTAFINAKQTVESRRRSLDLAEKIYKTTQIKYKEGVGSSLETTQAEQEVYTAQSNLINALYDVIVAKTDLDIALGTI